MKLDLEILADADALATRAAERVAAAIQVGLKSSPRFTLALAGGSTPRRFHKALAEGHSQLDWSRIHILWSDERAVPADHADSNVGMAQETLLRNVPIPAANIHRPDFTYDAVAAARDYEQRIRELAPDGISLVMLGMGPDGHTASLFPDGPSDFGTDLVAAVEAPPASPIRERITFTYRALSQARQVYLLIAGADKAERVHDVLETASTLPAARVLAERIESVVLVDRAAAARLEDRKERRREP